MLGNGGCIEARTEKLFGSLVIVSLDGVKHQALDEVKGIVFGSTPPKYYTRVYKERIMTNNDKHASMQVGSDTDWSMVATGNNHTVGIKEDGELFVWSDNSNIGEPYYHFK